MKTDSQTVFANFSGANKSWGVFTAANFKLRQESSCFSSWKVENYQCLIVYYSIADF